MSRMIKYNFDEEICRKGTSCIKHDRIKQDFGCDDVIPLWIADMDFKTPEFILDAVRNCCNQHVLGYTFPTQEYFSAITAWVSRKHGWIIQNDWLGFVPGVVSGIAFCIKTFTIPGDKIVIQPPVYPPFHHLVKNNDRELVFNPLKIENGLFVMDYEDLENKLKQGCKMMILCNPHNPGGRSWEKHELKKVSDLCAQYNTLVVSDEIHADLVLPGYQQVSFATVSPEAMNNSITLMAPSKTFNMAGVGSSYYIVPNQELREKLKSFLAASELNNGHIFAFSSTQIAYEKGEEWLKQVCEYIHENIIFVDKYLKQHIPQIKSLLPQASFLVWLDCRNLGLDQQSLNRFFLNKAKLALNDGQTFGVEGKGFMRLNVGTTRATLEKAMLQLKVAVDGLNI